MESLQEIPQDIRGHSDTVPSPMPTQKTSLRITLFRVEKTKWSSSAKQHRLCLSEFVRWTVNTKVRIPTLDLAAKLEKRKPEQLSIIDMTGYDAQCAMF